MVGLMAGSMAGIIERRKGIRHSTGMAPVRSVQAAHCSDKKSRKNNVPQKSTKKTTK